MIKVSLFAAASAVMLFGAQACKKDSNTDDNQNNTNTSQANKGKIVCKANGKEWISDGPSKKYVVKYIDSFFSFDQNIYGNEGSIFGDTLSLSAARVIGTDSTSMAFEIVLSSARKGTYNIGNFPPKKAGTASAYFYGKLGMVAYDYGFSDYNTTGSITLTSFSDSLKTCSGTFNFNMVPKNSANPKTPSHTVTSGVFTDVKFD